MANAKEIIAKRVALELQEGDVVNLGIGLPTLVANFIPETMDITLQSENGILGMERIANEGEVDRNITNAGAQYVTVRKGASFFDSALSFAIIRGGHVDVTVLGALEVDAKGTIASHIIPGKMVPGMGGAMDLVVGAKKVIIATTHTNKGKPKILEEVTLPKTAVSRVNLIITELAVMEITKDGLLLKEIHPETTLEEVFAATGAKLLVSGQLKFMEV